MREDRQWAPAWLLTFPFRSSTNTAEADIVFVAAAASTCESTHTHTHAQSLKSDPSLHRLHSRFISSTQQTFISPGWSWTPTVCFFFFPEGAVTSSHAGETFTSSPEQRRRRRRVCRSVCPLEGAADTRIIAGTESEVVRFILNVPNCYWILNNWVIVHKVFD